MQKETIEKWSRTISLLLQIIGVLGVIFVPVFWAFTGRVESSFLPFFGLIAGVGRGLDVLQGVTQNRGDSNEP